MKFVDITNDIAFRKIFGNDNKKKTLISFLNAVLNFPINKQIVDVEITNPYQLGILSGSKSTIVDVKAKDKEGNVFIVEMQISEQAHFTKRILYYASQCYVAQIDKGHKYGNLRPVYFIGILEFEFGSNPNYYTRQFVIDVETKEHLIQDIEFHFISLPRFKKSKDELKTSIDHWTYFIKNAENLDVIPESVLDEGLKEAYIEANEYNWTNLELDDYLRASLKEQDDLGRIELAEERAVKRGMEKEKIEIAKKMKEQNFSIETIILLTGVSIEELNSL